MRSASIVSRYRMSCSRSRLLYFRTNAHGFQFLALIWVVPRRTYSLFSRLHAMLQCGISWVGDQRCLHSGPSLSRRRVLMSSVGGRTWLSTMPTTPSAPQIPRTRCGMYFSATPVTMLSIILSPTYRVVTYLASLPPHPRWPFSFHLLSIRHTYNLIPGHFPFCAFLSFISRKPLIHIFCMRRSSNFPRTTFHGQVSGFLG